MRDQDCPLCAGPATRARSPFSYESLTGAGDLFVHCRVCGEFSLDAGLLALEWRTIPPEEKAALAVSLRETQWKYGVGYHLTADNWRRLARQGKKIHTQ
jgi:hypothetical protein